MTMTTADQGPSGSTPAPGFDARRSATTQKYFHGLISAARHGQATDVDALLRTGADPNVLGRSLRPGEGRVSALAMAIERAGGVRVGLLLAHGARVGPAIGWMPRLTARP